MSYHQSKSSHERQYSSTSGCNTCSSSQRGKHSKSETLIKLLEGILSHCDITLRTRLGTILATALQGQTLNLRGLTVSGPNSFVDFTGASNINIPNLGRNCEECNYNFPFSLAGL